jgi:putative ABC transport system permease protein
MTTLWQDIRCGIRTLRRNPGFTGIAVIVLALGIGVNTGVFSVAQWLCLRPAPFAEPQRVVRLLASREGRVSEGFCYPDYLALKEQMTSLSDLAAVEYRGATLKGEPWSRDLTVAVVSRNYFSVLGVQACVGYVFSENDDEALRSRAGIVISHALWRSQFGADPRLVGGPITLDDRSYTLLGIAPADFTGERYTMPPDVWYPVETWDRPEEQASRDVSSFALLGRLRPDVSAPEAQREAEVVFRRLPVGANDHSHASQIAPTPLVIPEPEYRLGETADSCLFQGGIAALVFLIACANISSLLLARTETGLKELAVRRSLGCTRLHLVRQVFIEGGLLALISLPVSLFLTHGAIGILRASVSGAAADPVSGIRLDLSTAGFCVGITFLATLVFGLFPALYASRADLLNALKTDVARVSHAGRTLRGLNTLVAGQLALGLILTATASLLFRSYLACCTTDLGFDRDNVLLAEVSPEGGPDECLASLDQLLTQVRSLPGVRDASVGITAPYVFTQNGWTRQVSLPGKGVTDQTACAATCNVVDPHFFATLGIPILRGRGFEEYEGRSGSKVIVINETLAKRLWPAGDPVGQFVRIGLADSDLAQVIGVVRDGKYHSITRPVEPYMYVPLGRESSSNMLLPVKTDGPPAALQEAVRQTIRKLAPTMDLYPMTSLAAAIRASVGDREADVKLAGTLSLLGLILACAGLYGVVSFAVGRRTQELGIRMALGALRQDIIRLILWHGVKLGALGLLFGLGGTLFCGQVLKSALYGISPVDPMALTASSLMLMAVVLAACYLPARRAARIDPMAALRYE